MSVPLSQTAATLSADVQKTHQKLVELANDFTKNRISAQSESHRTRLVAHMSELSTKADWTLNLFTAVSVRVAVAGPEAANFVRALCTG